MELHSCHNCQVIEEVISSKLRKFEVLTEENLTLHQVLLKARESLVSLQAEVASLNNIIVMERQRNLGLYLSQLNQQNNSNVLMNVVLQSNAKDVEKHLSYTKQVSFQPTTPHPEEQVLVNKYETLMSLYEEQTKVYEENLETLKTVNEKYIKNLEEELCKMQDHSSTILSMYSFYRTQLFEQKLKNTRDRKEFLETVDILSNLNKKHMVKMEQQLLEQTTCAVNEQTRGVLNSLLQQIHKRDKLVYMLRRHQMHFDKETGKLEKQLMIERQNAEKINNNLREMLQNEKRKYSALEQRRIFDFQGFQTDIQQFRKKLKNKENTCALEQEIDSIEKKLRNSYLK